MIIISWQSVCRSEVVLLIDDTIANTGTPLQVGGLGVKKAGVIVWAASYR